jgi:hypothetical protein
MNMGGQRFARSALSVVTVLSAIPLRAAVSAGLTEESSVVDALDSLASAGGDSFVTTALRYGLQTSPSGFLNQTGSFTLRIKL